MLRYVHQLVANFFCPTFVAGQVVYRGVYRAEKKLLMSANNGEESGETEPKH